MSDNAPKNEWEDLVRRSKGMRINSIPYGEGIGIRWADARIRELEAEITALRQAHWDGRAIGGFDNDGDPTPVAVVSDFAEMIRNDWRDIRAQLDEVDSRELVAENQQLRERIK